MKKFDAKRLVDELQTEGCRQPYDQSRESLPDYYNAHLYERGCHFYRQHIFALFYSKFIGLVTTLALPNINRRLRITGRSDTPTKAFKRYISTIQHMCLWYDINSDNRWRSWMTIKRKHASANQILDQQSISQLDMVITQFGFMGYAVMGGGKVGVHIPKNSPDWLGFIHIWRVIGHVMGVDERYNLCRESIEETRDFCEELFKRVLIPFLRKNDDWFLKMSDSMITGMWSMNPGLRLDVTLGLIYDLVMKYEPKIDENPYVKRMNVGMRVRYWAHVYTLDYLRYYLVEWFFNCLQILTLWLIRVFPFLAFYQHGFKQSFIDIRKDFH